MRVESMLDSYVKVRPGITKASLDRYYQALRSFKKVMGRDAQRRDLCDERLCEYMQKAIDGGMSPQTINSYRSIYVRLWQYAYKKGWMKLPPVMVPTVKEERKTPRALSTSELFSTIAYFEGIPNGRTPNDHWTWQHWRAFMMVLYDTGARYDAILSALRSDVDWDAAVPIIRLDPKRAKTRHEQHLKIGVDTMAYLKELVPNGDRLFPWNACKTSLRNRFVDALKSQGLYEKGMGFHIIRKTHATAAYANSGGDIGMVQRQLGHSNPQMTLRYIDPRKSGVTTTLDFLPRPPNPPSSAGPQVSSS